MKKVIIFILTIFTSASLFAQSLAFRKESNGRYVAGTNYMLSSMSFSKSTGVALTVYSNQISEEREYNMGIYFETSGPAYCQQGSKAIIKTFANSIITLHANDYEHADNEGAKYYYRIHYAITEDDLQRLINEGIQLIRIETSIGLIDNVFKKDILGKYLKKENEMILEKRDFSSDF